MTRPVQVQATLHALRRLYGRTSGELMDELQGAAEYFRAAVEAVGPHPEPADVAELDRTLDGMKRIMRELRIQGELADAS